MTEAHPELSWWNWLKEFLNGWHRFTCPRCQHTIHPWEEHCPNCDIWINWENKFNLEKLEHIRYKHNEYSTEKTQKGG